MSEQRRYAAFISYSHKDERFARWLHRALESYQPPKGLLAAAGRKKASPVFRDADELSASADLTGEIREALDRSDALIVICSPHAVMSKWVAREIEYFRETGKGDRIFPIIAEGEPNASADMAALECLPELLRAREDGHEALAADARGEALQRRAALLKLVAGLMGMSLGELVDRDAKRRRERLTQIVAGAGAIATVLAVLVTAWMGEMARSAAETRNRLMGEMRQAFEVEDAPRGVAVLGRLWSELDADQRERHQPVLSSWLARWRTLGDALAEVPEGAVFASGRRLYLRQANSIRALPFDDASLVLPTPTGAFALDTAGRLWRAEATSAAPTEITPADAKASAGGLWARYFWEHGVPLKGGALAFAGRVQSSSAGGALPALLLVDPSGGGWRVIEQDYLESPTLSVDSACANLTVTGSPGERTGMTIARADGPAQTFSLQTAKAVAAAPGTRTAIPFGGEMGETMAALAAACGAGLPQTSDRDLRLQLALPTPASDVQDWTASDIADELDRKLLDGLFGLGQLVQRGMFAVSEERLAAARAEGYTADDVAAIAPKIAGEFWGYDAAAAGTDTLGPVGVYKTVSGAQYGGAYVCAGAPEGRTDAQARCLDILYHGNYGGVRVFDDFVYVQDRANVGHPMFHIVRRSDLAHFRMDAPEVQDMPGGGPGGVALTPSGAALVMAAADRLWRFALEDGQPRFIGRVDAAGLAGPESGQGFGVEVVTMAALDETKVVVARSDGLVFAADAETGAELWRTRIRPTAAPEGDAPHRIAVADGRIAILGADFVAVLDAATGLALAPVKEVYLHSDVTPLDLPPEPVDRSCPEASRREACFSTADLATVVMEAELRARPLLRVAEDGSFLVRSSEGLLRFAPPAEAAIDPASAPCRTGWEVTQKHGIVRHDLLERLAPGAERALSTFCARFTRKG